MVPYPKKKGYAVDFATSGPAIAKGSKVRAAAWEWLKFRQGPEGQAVRAAEGTAVGFQPEARKVLQEALGAIPSLETPAALVELLEGGRHSFVRLLSAAQAQIHGELINPELNKVWRNEEAAADTARRVAAAVNGFLRTHPQ
jgi:ABC-type glycerol-3-phosphate transport system substrate-binding protein